MKESFAVAQQQWHRKLSLQQRRKDWKRRATTVAAAVLIWFGVALTTTSNHNSLLVPAVHASSTTTSSLPVTERLLQHTSPKVDDLIDRYVRQHMFDDDYTQSDPVSSTYREAYHDATVGRHPAALREITADVLQGKDLTVKTATGEGEDDRASIGAMLTTVMNALQTKAGLSETASIVLLSALFVVVGPSAFLLGGMIIGGISKRNMNQLFRKRYGEDFTLDATVKKEEAVEAPDDDEEEEDEDDDEDVDEGDDDNNKK